MVLRKYSVLLFDIGNVFLFADHNITHRFLVKQFHIPLESAQKFYKIPEYRLFSKGEINGTQFAQAVRLVLGKTTLSDKQIKKAHHIHLVKPIKSAIRVLNTIHDKNVYQIAFITNTNPWQNERERQLVDFTEFSEVIIRSNEEGLTKESPELFSRALESLKSKKVLFIDDNLTNIKTAKTLGIDTLHVTKNNPRLRSGLQSKGVILD